VTKTKLNKQPMGGDAQLTARDL